MLRCKISEDMKMTMPGFLWASQGCHGSSDTVEEAMHHIERVLGEKCILSSDGWKRAARPFADREVIAVCGSGEIIPDWGYPDDAEHADYHAARRAFARRTAGEGAGSIMTGDPRLAEVA